MNDLMTKSFMNYVELKKAAMKDMEAGDGDFGEDVCCAASADGNLRRFFEEAGRVREEMEQIRRILVRLNEASEESRSLYKPESLKSLRARINDDVVKVLRKARGMGNVLEEMDRENAVKRRLSGCKEACGPTRTSITNGLRKKLKDLMMDFQTLRQKMMSEYKETVERRYFTVTGRVPEDEMIESIISNGDSEDFLQKAIQEHGKGKVMATVLEIQDRHDTAKENERSLLELHQVFLDMAVMVEAQGEEMNGIEHHVSNAADYVNGGVKQLTTAKDYQRTNRKWIFVGLILLLILVVIVPVSTSLKSS